LYQFKTNDVTSERVKYTALAIKKASKARNEYDSTRRDMAVTSATPIVIATDEFLAILKYSLIKGGRLIRKACGKMTKIML
jgi:hypothetical protein